MKTLALRARVFIHCFLVFGYPGETLALVVHILHKRCLTYKVVPIFFYVFIVLKLKFAALLSTVRTVAFGLT